MQKSRKYYYFPFLIFSIVSCSRKEFYPKIEKVEPNIAWTGENTQVEIVGEDFVPAIKIKTQSQKVESIPPILKLGDNIELTNITYFSRAKIVFIVPKGLPPGEYKLKVLLANGKSDDTYFRITRLPKPFPESLNNSSFSNGTESTVIIYGKGFDEIVEITLIREDGKEFIVKDFVSSSTEIRFNLPQGAETGNFYVIIKNSEGIKSDKSDKIVLKILEGPKVNVRDSYEIDPVTGKVKIIFEIENSGEVELDNVEIELSNGQKLKVGKVGKQKVYVEAYTDESTDVSWIFHGKDSISFASVAKQGQINICKKLYYKDEDGDGYGDKNKFIYSCNVPYGYVNNSDDCNDLDPKVNPSTVWYKDNDGDGYTDGSTYVGCIPPQKYLISIPFGDCNDENKNINPNSPEVCNGIDDNCNNQIDEEVEIAFYRDRDGDGYGNLYDIILSCSQPPGYVPTPEDCNDNNPMVNPISTETCNGIDDDCDGLVDEGVALVFYNDSDGDGYGNPSIWVSACSKPSGYVENSLDCDDSNPNINPFTVWYKDIDEDSYSDGITQIQCARPSKHKLPSELISTTGDCDDTDPSIYPGAPLNCNNGQDNDCSGVVERWFFQDQDSDSWTTSVSQCADFMPTGFTSVSKPLDCNDSDSSIYPGAPLNCNNGQDNDCSGNIERWAYMDADGDRHAPNSSSSCVDTVSFPGMITVGSHLSTSDCNDSDSSIYPGAPLNCNNNKDNDCSGNIERWVYQDSDGDLYSPNSVSSCTDTVSFPGQITVTSALGTNDCNDTNASIYPGAPLNCLNGQDNDCSGKVDEYGYTDSDGDLYAPNSLSSCTNVVFPGQITVGSELGTNDCNDTTASIYPGAPLNCNNGQDNDCSGVVEAWFFQDQDSDSWTTSVSQCADFMPTGFTSVYNPLDCNDTDSSIYPGAPLNCNNGQDNDCSGVVERWFFQDQDSDSWTTSVSQCANSMPTGFTSVYKPLDCNDNNALINPNTIWYKDADFDNYYPAGGSSISCSDPYPENSTYTALNSGDCDDNNSSVNPGASETCNGIDDNCDTNIDEGLVSCYIPSCPTSITATSFFGSSTGDISIQITWNDPATNESNFVVEKSKSPLFSPSATYVIPADTTLKTLTFQEPLTQFWFRVWATNSSGSCIPITTTNIFTPPGLLWAFELTDVAQTWDNLIINPKAFDLNGDNTKEIIIADNSGYVYAISTVKQNLEVFAKPLWIYYAGSGWRSGNPAIAIYQGSPTVVIPMNNPGPGRKIVYINRYGQSTYQINVPIDSYPPVLTDMNGDSIPDILFSSDNNDRIRAFTGGTEIFNINPPGRNSMPALFHFKGSLTHYVFGTDNQKILGYVGTNQVFEFNLPSKPLDFITTGDIDSDGFSEGVILRDDNVIDVIKLIKNPLLIYDTANQINSKPAFADFNSDGITDVVFTAGNNLYFVYGGSETATTCNLTSPSFSSPAVIQGNPPTVVVGRDFLPLSGEIVRIRADCSIFWQQDAGLNKNVRSSPLVFDIDEDGEMEVIIGTTDTTLNSGQVIIINLANGSVEATVSPLEMGRIYSSARADDIDNDGIPEIVIGSDKASLLGSGGAYIISCGGNGTNCSSPQIKLTATKSGWGKVRTTPLIYDLNNDGYKDIILAEDNNETLFAISGTSVVNGQTYTLWEISLSGVGIGTPFPSSPTIIVKSGIPYIAVGSDNSTLYIVNGATGTLISSFGAGGKIYSSPTTLDYNLDGVPDLVFGSDDNKVYVLSGTDFTTVLFSYQTGNKVRSSAGLVDFDGDGITDFGIGSDDGKIYIFNGRKSLICETAPFSNLVNIKPQVAIYNRKGVFGTTNSRFVMNLTDCSVLYHDASGGVDPYTSFGVFYTDGLTKFVFSRSNEIYVSEENFLRVYPFPFTYSVASGFSSPIIDDIDGDGSLEFAIVSIAGSSKVFAYRITNTEFSIKFGQFAHDRHNTSFSDYIPPLNLAPHLKFYDESRFEIQKESGCKSTNLISITLIFTLFYIFKFLKDLICPNKRNTKLRENNQFFIDQKYDKRLK